jgi:hypothetical protein
MRISLFVNRLFFALGEAAAGDGGEWKHAETRNDEQG